MWNPEQPRGEPPSLLASLAGCLYAVLRCLCCLDVDSSSGEGGQRLLSAHQETLGIEASASPPRLPSSSALAAPDRPLLKGQGPSSSGSLPAPSPPPPLPFFPPPRHKRRGSGDSQQSGGGGGGGGSPAAGGRGKGGSRASLGEEAEDICPTCLDPYSEDNPRVLTRCGHHFHLPCLYEWLERSETCPVCAAPMHFEELLP